MPRFIDEPRCAFTTDDDAAGRARAGGGCGHFRIYIQTVDEPYVNLRIEGVAPVNCASQTLKRFIVPRYTACAYQQPAVPPAMIEVEGPH